ncbi:hypothetical protein [Streptomyces violaceusniger]|uniref:Uncharacterized protein n=1 Tax=Streptomyces violaceusniger (strain Tu 4113) TaxID=653045 RepID=G2PHK8_STRV4|nr:hypothetical protein [Streptomyces violaceusniger]AEM89011.1 hypothetical protein Strvi_0238 [Streptomyces violaceusniger Tu 4113]
MSSHIKNMEEAARRRREARQGRRGGSSDGEGQPATGAEVELRPGELPTGPPPKARPQPFTPDLIPEPVAVEATGDLSPDEAEDLRQCERAFANADEAEWMRGKAAHAVRDRRLYRPRTWPDYCEEVLGESESEVNRMIQEWPIGAMITQIWVTPRPTPASHRRALLPLVDLYGLEATARGYVLLRTWAAENNERVTATVLTAMVDQRQLAGAKPQDEPLPVTQFLERKKTKALERGRSVPPQPAAPKQEGPPLPPSTPAPERQETPSGTPQRETEHPPAPDDSTPHADTSTEEPSEIIDAEIVDDSLATGVRQAMQDAREGIEGKLRGADPDLLKTIISLGEEITSAAREELTQRGESARP